MKRRNYDKHTSVVDHLKRRTLVLEQEQGRAIAGCETGVTCKAALVQRLCIQNCNAVLSVSLSHEGEIRGLRNISRFKHF